MRDFLTSIKKHLGLWAFVLVLCTISNVELFAQCPIEIEMVSVNAIEASCPEANDGQVRLTFERNISAYSFSLIDVATGRVVTAPQDPFSKISISKNNNQLQFDRLSAGRYKLLVKHAQPNCYLIYPEKQNEALFVIEAATNSCHDEK